MTAEPAFHDLARGDEFLLPSFSFDASSIRAYLDATGEPVERWDGVVPPIAAGALALGALMERVPLPGGALHAGQEFEFLRAIAPGESLETLVRVAQRSERRGTLLLALEVELRSSSDGETVLRGRSTVAAPAGEAAS
ncbi:MAG: hypothetical protein F4Z60_14040 [Chloroflexi bacterium]|nr:hypothetical protein [Chloroflexota bacterium]